MTGAVITAGVVRFALSGAGDQDSKKEAENPLTASLAKKDQELAAALRAHDSTRQELEALSLTHQNTQFGYSEIAGRLTEAERKADQTQRDKDESVALSKQALDDFAVELAAAKAQMVSAQEEIDQLKRAQAGGALLAQQQYDALQTERDALAAELAALRQRAQLDGDGANAEINRLDQTLRAANTQLDEARRALAATATESGNRLRDINALQVERAALVADLTRTAREGLDNEVVLGRQRDVLAAELAALKVQSEQLTQQGRNDIGALTQHLRGMGEELRACKAELAALQEAHRVVLGAREYDRSDAARHIAALELERDSAIEQAKRSKEENDALARRLGEEQRILRDLNREAGADRVKLAEARNEAFRHGEMVSELRTDRARRGAVKAQLEIELKAARPDRLFSRDEVANLLGRVYL
ncbi:MAG: hypothetical protein QG604_586 [Candidatus Dependentiae bacterium]|nr:hypothetical protein [Candidatus Dependentiae bacterium]